MTPPRFSTAYFFKTPVWIVDLRDTIGPERDRQLELARVLAATDPGGVERSNSGGWQSRDARKESELARLFEMLTTIVGGFSKALYRRPDSIEIEVKNAWINVNPPFSYNTTHVHAGAHWSGVYYVTAPENSGDLILGDPRPGATMIPHPGDEPDDLAGADVVLPPLEGTAYLFPAFLPHSVGMNRSKSARVSIGFNLGYADPPG